MSVVLSDSLKSLIKHDEYIELRALLKNVDLASIKDSNNRTLLHYAALYNSLRMTKLFIEFHCDIEAKDRSGITPLFLAAENSRFDAMGVLINANADIFYTTPDGRSTLATIFGSQEEMPECILKNVLKVIKDTYPSDAEVANLLIKIQFPFHRVVHLKNSEITRMMLDGGSPVNDRNRHTDKTALQEAMLLQDVENVKVLLQYNAEIGIDSKVFILAFHRSINDYTIKDLQVAYLIIERLTKSDLLNEYGYFLLGPIFKLATKEVLEKFLQFDIDLSGRDMDGKTLLHHLALNCKQGTIELLRNKRIDVNAKDDSGHTALHYAVAHENCIPKNVKFLLEKGTDLEKTDEEVAWLMESLFPNKSYSSSFVSHGHKECMELLLEYGVDPQTLKKNGMSVIDFALCCNSRYKVQLLLDPVVAHITLIAANNEPVRYSILHRMQNHFILNECHMSCTKEIEMMQGHEVAKGITLFQILNESEEQIRKYVKLNKDLPSFMSRKDMPKLNSYYNLRLKNKISRSVETIKLTKVAIECIMNIVPVFNGEHLIVNEIVNCLSYADLLMFS